MERRKASFSPERNSTRTVTVGQNIFRDVAHLVLHELLPLALLHVGDPRFGDLANWYSIMLRLENQR